LLSETLRLLSPLERLVDAIVEINGFNFCMAVSFRGKITHPRWMDAFAQLQQRHPLLNASLNHDDPQLPFLRRLEDLPIPLKLELRTSPTQWERVVETECEQPFADAAAPLVRAVLLEDDHGCDLILTSHHTILDGIGAVSLLRDLLTALAGEKLRPLALPPSVEERLAEARRLTPAPPADSPRAIEALRSAEASLHFLAGRPARFFERHTGERRPTISSLRLSPEETGQWLRCARAHQVTLGAVLLASLAAAARRLNPSLKQTDIRLAVPVNARPYLKNEDDAVFCISTPYVVSLYPEMGVWESARALSAQLAALKGLDAIDTYLQGIKAIMDAGLDTKTLVEFMASQYGADLTLTNLKSVDFPKLPEGLSVEAVWGPAVSSPIAGHFVIGAATANGALHLVYTTYAPLPGMLETTRAIITQACA
jgi:NRPS condensation-like uncharacterized protein